MQEQPSLILGDSFILSASYLESDKKENVHLIKMKLQKSGAEIKNMCVNDSCFDIISRNKIKKKLINSYPSSKNLVSRLLTYISWVSFLWDIDKLCFHYLRTECSIEI